MKPSTTASEPADLTLTATQWSPTGAADPLYCSANCCTRSAIDGSAITATVSLLPEHAAALCERLDSASPKNRHTITPATTTTTVTNAAITPMLTPRRPPSLR